MPIKDNLNKIKESLPSHITLVAVSKTKSKEDIMEAYSAGQRIFGENKIQEMTDKQAMLPKDIQWHMIGHIQRNKVKYMAEYVSLIHAVDSLKLLKEINKQAKKCNRVIPCLLQIHIAEEDTKFGFDEKELNETIASNNIQQLTNVKIVGLMGMATFTDNTEQIRKEFKQLKHLFEKTKTTLPDLSQLSMGMSGDYQVAIEEGSTMIRVGSSIFGSRN
jgi:pyridoxal phosphate enzyme (YggS family)